jgi:hypothetical protein
MLFYVGLDDPYNCQHFPRACVSINRLRTRKKPLGTKILLDSGAFTELHHYGAYRHSPSEYANSIRRLVNDRIADIEIAVSQDYMCEPFMLAKTGLTIPDHQHMTIERYDALILNAPVMIMPVLQGYKSSDYVRHIGQYGNRLLERMWVGVGSVCKRNGNPQAVVDVLDAIKRERPDLRLHGFGVKLTALGHSGVRELLHSADSMAWSYHARKNGRNAHDWREAQAFCDRIDNKVKKGFEPWQPSLFLE